MTLPRCSEKSTLCGHSNPTVAQGSPPPQRPCPLRLRRKATRLAVIISTCMNSLETHRSVRLQPRPSIGQGPEGALTQAVLESGAGNALTFFCTMLACPALENP